MGPCPIQSLQSPWPLQLPTCAFIQATIDSHQLVASAGAPDGGFALTHRSQDAVKLPGLPHIICGPTPYRSMYVDIHCVMLAHH